MKMSGGRAAVAALKAAGVDRIFGLMGSSTLDMYDALYDEKHIRHIGVRDEEPERTWQMLMRASPAGPAS